MSVRNGVRIGSALSQWKKENPLSSLFARVLSKVGGFIGGTTLFVACIGAIASRSTLKNVPGLWTMVAFAVAGLIIDAGSHWVAMQIDRKLSANK